MNEVTDEQIAEYVAKPYARILVPGPPGEGYFAEVLEIPAAISAGATPDEAMAMIDDALGGVIAVMLEDGETIPEPIMGPDEYSGRFNLRVSSEAHRLATTRAQLEGVSLNQWVGLAVEARLAGQSLADEVVEKLLAALAAPVEVTETELVLRRKVMRPLSPADPTMLTNLGEADWQRTIAAERSTVDA